MLKKLHFISQNWRKEKSDEGSGSSPIKIHYFDNPKRFIDRIDEVYDFSISTDTASIIEKNPIKLHLLPFVLLRSYLCLC